MYILWAFLSLLVSVYGSERSVSSETRQQIQGPVCYQHAVATAIRPWIPRFASTDHGELRDTLFEDHRDELAMDLPHSKQDIIVAKIANKHGLEYRQFSNRHYDPISLLKDLLGAKIPVVIYVTQKAMPECGFPDGTPSHAMVMSRFEDGGEGGIYEIKQ